MPAVQCYDRQPGHVSSGCDEQNSAFRFFLFQIAAFVGSGVPQRGKRGNRVGGCTHAMHRCNRMTVDPRIPKVPVRNKSGFRRCGGG